MIYNRFYISKYKIEKLINILKYILNITKNWYYIKPIVKDKV